MDIQYQTATRAIIIDNADNDNDGDDDGDDEDNDDDIDIDVDVDADLDDALFLPWLPYDEFRRKFADERQDIQKKTFTKWINSHLEKTRCSPVEDLFLDLRDGHKLLVLLEVLTNSQYKPEKGRMRVHHINNLNKALNVLQEHGIKLVNISSDDIVSGNPKLTLGLIWLIALGFNGQNLISSHASNGIEKSLLSWIRRYTEPYGIIVNDFSSSWSDGRAFLYIIHANIPNFDLQSAIKKHPNARLKLAFELANRYFKINQLLDPEDVNTNKPDKKSILMYVMCLYHAIESKRSVHDLVQHSESMEQILLTGSSDPIEEDKFEKLLDNQELDGRKMNDKEKNNDNAMNVDLMQKQEAYHPGNITDLDEIPLNSNTDTNSEQTKDQTSLVRSSTFTISKTDGGLKTIDINIDDPRSEYLPIDSKSRPLSTATNASIEIGGYQTALEAVLALLLEDEEILSKEIPEPKDFQMAKLQFHENESLMYKLTDHQRYVGEALEEGSILISESQRTSGLSLEDQNEIRHQMVLLNERWETLRVRALDVQSKIHGRLAEFQIQQVEKLREFLTNAEDRISRMSDIGPSLNDLHRQKDEFEKFQNDLKEQQSLIDSLSNMVVIVNDETGRFSDLEDKLTALGERWEHVIKWKEMRSEKLHQYKVILKWMDAREKDIKAMESKELTELGSITRRMNNIRYCEYDLQELERYLTDLKQMITTTQEGQNTDKILEQLENFEDRLDALKQIIEVQRIRIETMGFKFSSKDKKIERPNSWTDFQMIIKFSDDEMESSEQYDADSSAQSNKKRKLQKSDNLYLLEGKILENFNFLDACDDKINSLNRQSLKDQSQVIDNIKKDLQERENNSKDLEELYKKCENDDPDQNLMLEAAQVKEIVERYTDMSLKVDELREDIKQMLTKDKFYKSLTGFKLVLADSRDWYKQHANTATRNDLENRLSDMESLSDEIAEAKAVTVSLSLDFVEWKKDFDQFYDSWNDMKKAIIRLIQEKGGFDEVNRKMKALEDFVEEIDVVNVIVSDEIKMNANLNKLNSLKSKYMDLEDEFNYVTENSSADKIEEFVEIWLKIPDIINERIIKQNTAIENLKHFNTEYDTILTVIKNLEKTLQSDIFVVGENDTLQKQSAEYDVHATDLKKIEIDVISAKNFSEIIIKQADDEHKTELNDRITKLNDYYTRLLDIYQKNSKKLHQIQTKTEEILQRLHKIELWLNDLEMNTPKMQNSEITNSNELFQIKTKFQTLKETCEKETIKFRELNEIGSDLLLQIDELVQQNQDDKNNKNTYLAKKFTRLNARWNEVTSLVYNRTAILEHISSQLGEFKKLIVSENGYLDKLEKKLRNSPETAADAEEIIEELDDLENNLRNHSDDRLDKIQDIGSELIELGFMTESIQNEVQTIVDRWNQLQQKAKQRAKFLEQEMSEAEKSEKSVTSFEKWLCRVDEILTEHLDNDITIEDLPHDFQRLAEEFRKNEKTLVEVRELIAQHAKKGKVEAANRLKEQLNLLENRFKSCQLKLDKCTAPQAGYESRLSRALGELRNVERTTLVLDVASAGPSIVQDQYQHCLKIYRTLSEIKSEIESTIKIGRKVCEDKFTKDPKQLGQRIDALKHLYNALGESVTQAKLSLENLLKLSKQLYDTIDVTEKLIKSYELQENHINHNKNTIFHDIEELLKKCENIYDEYSKSCETIYMEDIRKKIDILRKKYLKLSSADVVKSLNEMKSTLQNLDNIPVETLKTMENDLQNINVATDDSEIEILHSQVIGIVKDAIEKISATSKQNVTIPSTTSTTATTTTTTTTNTTDTEIVVLSDTVRQRRARTPSSNEFSLNNNTTSTSNSNESSSNMKNINNDSDERSSTKNDQKIEQQNQHDQQQQQQQPSQQNPNVLPDLLPKTFRLAETSSLFSQISQNKSGQKKQLHRQKRKNEEDEEEEDEDESNENENEQHQQQNDHTMKTILNSKQSIVNNSSSLEQQVAVVEVREKDLNNRKMSVQNIDVEEILQPKIGQIIDTINVLESVDTFEPEYVETVHIIDASEDTSDTDSSLPPSDTANNLKRSLDNLVEYELEKEMNENRKKMKSEKNHERQNDENDQNMGEEQLKNDQDDDDETVELRQQSPSVQQQQQQQQEKILRVGKQRISFEEKRKRIESERDILRDSEDELETNMKSPPPPPPSRQKPKRSRNNPLVITKMDCDSFYNSDKENFDEPLVFSEDEDIPRFSLEMTTGIDSDSDTSRIETPSAKKSNAMQNKLSADANIAVTTAASTTAAGVTIATATAIAPAPAIVTGTSPRYEMYKSSTSLEQRVQEFDKTAKYMIRKLEATKERIESCKDGESSIEHLKLSMAPDAATLISQGDTLVLETHGKPGNLSQIVMRTQTTLREKFRELQQARISKTPPSETSATLTAATVTAATTITTTTSASNVVTTTMTDATVYYKNRVTNEKNEMIPSTGKILTEKRLPSDLNSTKINPEINIEELTAKGLKRIYDLIEKPLDRRSETELRRRILEINDRKDDLKLAFNAVNKSKSQIKSKKTMDALEKAKSDLAAHADSVETSLENLNIERLQQQEQQQHQHHHQQQQQQHQQHLTNRKQSIEKMTSVDDQQKILIKADGENSKKDKSKDAYIPGSFSAKQTKSQKVIHQSSIGTFDKSILQISDWLAWEQNMIKSQSIPVGDIDAIRIAIEKQKNVLRELEVKKPQLNELVHTAETLKTDVNRQQLQEKVTRLREHWDETSQCVLQRASQLKNMLGDSQRYESKRLEIETWLSRMENRSDRMGTVATTADVLEAQQKEQKSFHAELHQYKNQIELFNALTQKLIAVYPTDDTSRIKRMTESVNQRYNKLNNAVINRGKLLHTAVHNLQNFDRSMDQFLAFLSEAESLCENAEAEIDRNPLILKVSQFYKDFSLHFVF